MAIEVKDPMKVEALRHKLRIALKTGDWKLQVFLLKHRYSEKSSLTYMNYPYSGQIIGERVFE